MTHSSTIDHHVGISQGFHDAGAAVVSSDGKIVFAGHSERYSKNKNDPQLDCALMNEVRRSALGNIKINYYERSWLTNLRRFWTGQKLHNKVGLRASLKYAMLPIEHKSWGHHLSHAATAFQTSPFDSSAVIIVDAIGEWDTASIWRAWYDDQGRAQYKKLWSQKYPHSIGLFYSAMTKRVGLKPMEDEYILMGMAAYGDKSRVAKAMYDEFIVDVRGGKFKQNLHLGCDDWRPDLSNENIAASTQWLTEQMLLDISDRAKKLTNETNLCYGGGVALNCSFNKHLPWYWNAVWIPPNPGDCGSALGAAALGYGKRLDWRGTFLGHNIRGNLDVDWVVDELISTGIVGVANGPAEWGPRALGNRSLLADPRREGIRDRVNDIKQRQRYRPFAPAVLEEHAREHFDLRDGACYRYMQYAVHTKDGFAFPAVRHIDGTARVQTVPEGNSNMRKLLEVWYAKTGCPMLMNTSLNIKGQPMVNDANDAYRFQNMYGVKVAT